MKKSVVPQLIYVIFSTILIACFSVGCSKSGTKPSTNNPPPGITSINVNTGPYNTSVTITGTNFSTTKADDKVFFNGMAAVVQDATTTVIYTSVPLGAGTGNVTVSVNGNTATGPVFSYEAAEVVIPFVGSGDTTATNGTGNAAGFYEPCGLAIDASGNIYVADQAHHLIRKITAEGVVSTVAGNGKEGYADGSAATAEFNNPTGVAVDAAGNIFVADMGNNLIRKITIGGIVSTVAGSTTKGYADGVGSSAKFNSPTDLVVDAAGNLYITDFYNCRIRKITPDGSVSTFAGSGTANSQDGYSTLANIDGPIDIAIDKAGNLYITEADNLIRKITPGQVVTSIAGTVASTLTSTFGLAQGLFVDNNANLYIENSGHYQIDKVDASGQLSIFAGTGNQNDILGIVNQASFNFMQGIVVDENGNIYVSETDDHIREISFK